MGIEKSNTEWTLRERDLPGELDLGPPFEDLSLGD
jgi:hypothetical protein